MSVAFVIHA